jgi:hypothetical protein
LWTMRNSTSGRTNVKGFTSRGDFLGSDDNIEDIWEHYIIQKQKTGCGACWCSSSNHCGRQTSPITWWCRKQRRPRRSSLYIHYIVFLYPFILTLLLLTQSCVIARWVLFIQGWDCFTQLRADRYKALCKPVTLLSADER